jgi:hypothetical protein
MLWHTLTGAGLRAMLETVNWKKEVIVSALENPDGKHMLQVLLLIQVKGCFMSCSSQTNSCSLQSKQQASNI